MTVTKKILYPNHNRPVALVDPVAFFLALVFAPVLVGILGAPVLLIPSFAVLVGGLPYLIIGGPILWFALRRGRTDPDSYFGLGFKTIAILALPIALWFAGLSQINGASAGETGALLAYVGLIAVLCAVFAGLWGMVFASLYRRLRNPNFPT